MWVLNIEREWESGDEEVFKNWREVRIRELAKFLSKLKRVPACDWLEFAEILVEYGVEDIALTIVELAGDFPEFFNRRVSLEEFNEWLKEQEVCA